MLFLLTEQVAGCIEYQLQRFLRVVRPSRPFFGGGDMIVFLQFVDCNLHFWYKFVDYGMFLLNFSARFRAINVQNFAELCK